MGSSASKAPRAASKLPATATTKPARKYPTRPPPPSPSTQTAGANVEGRSGVPEPGDVAASESRDQAALPLAASAELDPALDARLKSLGPVQPKPTQSNSSTFRAGPDPSLPSAAHFQPSASSPQQSIYPAPAPAPSGPAPRANPAVSLLTARYRLAAEAEREFAQTGKSSAAGRRFLDVYTLRQVLVLRDERGLEARQIERSLGLGEGVVAQLGRRGLVGVGS
ncbi:hypothetical protein QTJ16_000009 [Diplocarpon rosae]|uniref:Helix-turn-helix domain-containing protein n=1 Tax=Diplocarpon rosae TaxID=946125 RepID=A0AAD9T5Q7_9HELO|nr:hypothetical protein QTJ16_000009 [Diplocarpon rosae]